VTAVDVLPNPRCPRCGAPNGCVPVATGSFAKRCWCEDIAIDPRLIDRLPDAARKTACLCAACAKAAPA
jgi:hypothetical protein